MGIQVDPTVDRLSVKSDSRVLAFVDIAEKYCTLMESLGAGKPTDFYSKLLWQLSKLAIAGAELPFGMPEQDVEDHGEMARNQSSKVAQDIADSISSEMEVLVAQYKDDTGELTRVVMLWEDLAEIYEDIRRGLVHFRTGVPDCQLQAVWDWRFHYENHWGSHLMRALVTVHEIRFTLHSE